MVKILIRFYRKVPDSQNLQTITFNYNVPVAMVECEEAATTEAFIIYDREYPFPSQVKQLFPGSDTRLLSSCPDLYAFPCYQLHDHPYLSRSVMM
jgi:hypothetical protein